VRACQAGQRSVKEQQILSANILAGKVAIVTGGAKGLGAAIVRLFVSEGAQVVISDVDAANGDQLAAECNGHAVFEKHDVSSEPDWERIIANTVSRFGKLDVLINNAGIVEIGDIETQTLEQWRRVNAVISDGCFFGCKHAVRAMKTTGGGTIVNVSSIASLQGESYVAAYSAAKGAVEALTRSVAVHCAQMKYPIRVNSLHPGPIDTPLVRDMPAKFKAAVRSGMVLPPAMGGAAGYTATPAEIAPSVLFLASDMSKWVNGTRLVIDNTASVTRGSVPV
jgi:3(or 17)beta-hydroxysteroid dehydrogenase